ncbi:C39 family peptidase [Synechococcus phage S-SZBM1]|uniref:C39 family peptidase n=1 Tax=Synechococcus phage S-SZBM1 TaxID=2926475 RepID=A0AC61TSE1_9CAUD|nr:endolysin [Synechococcus phage S-SZBM1]UNH61148.1 C39 family peptidase [Synechococcus phage S-SZBM1]
MARIDLHNFFKYYDEKNPNHIRAVQWLEDNLPEEFLDDSETEWVGIYRSRQQQPSGVLDVPYYNQIDNYRDAHRTCNSSACAMCLAYLRPGSIKGDDEYIKKVFAIGDTTDHSVQTKVLQSYGVQSQFHYNLTFADLDVSLERGKPVVIGILHRGSLKRPTGGHMVVVIGKTEDGSGYYIHDPYGSLNDNYTGPVSNGKRVIYSKAVLQHRWCPGGNDGWGRIFA